MLNVYIKFINVLFTIANNVETFMRMAGALHPVNWSHKIDNYNSPLTYQSNTA